MKTLIYYVTQDDIESYEDYKTNDVIDPLKIKADPKSVCITVQQLIDGLNEETISDTSLFAYITQ